MISLKDIIDHIAIPEGNGSGKNIGLRLLICELVEEKGNENRDLVICNKCLWSLSLLKGAQIFDRCPVCNTKGLEIIPVEDYEAYALEIGRKRGLSIEFSVED